MLCNGNVASANVAIDENVNFQYDVKTLRASVYRNRHVQPTTLHPCKLTPLGRYFDNKKSTMLIAVELPYVGIYLSVNRGNCFHVT